MSHRKKFGGLGDPSITAAFQRMCGINILRDAGADPSSKRHAASNGKVSNGYVGHYETGNSNSKPILSKGSNGSIPNSMIPNGCDSLLKAAGKNGHSHEIRKRITEGNSDCHFVGDESLKNKPIAENGHTNGIGNGIGNGSKKGTNGYCRHPPKSVHSNGDSNGISNGHAHQDTTEDELCHESEYSIDNYLLYYIMSFGASLGNEVFYVLFFTCSLWNFDNFVVRKALIFWCTAMYIGQAAKDIIRWPRPDSPPVVRLEKRYELEYGMPSTHAMVGVAIPFGMLYFMMGRYEFNLILGTLFCINWSILVSVSRLYLGMHSALDIVAGLLFAFILMGISMPYVEYVDTFLMTHPYAVPCLIAVGISLCLLYPSLDKWSTTRGDTTQSLAVFSGIYAGLWLTRHYSEFTPLEVEPPYLLQFPNSQEISMSLLREALGVLIVGTLLVISKFVLLQGLCKLFGYDPKDPESKKHLIIELPYKYVSYFSVSAFATYVMPLLFVHLDIHRPGFYSEMFLSD